MRLCSGIVVAGLLFSLAPRAHAVAPIFTETSLRGTHAAAATLERLTRKPAGVDRAERLRVTSNRHYRALVILLQFPPDPAIPGDPGFLADTLAHSPSAYDTLLFSQGTLPGGSMRDYYHEVSRDLFDIDGVVTRWYTAPHPYSYYTNGASGIGDPPNNAQQMARDAVALADADYDFRLFDSDGPDQTPNTMDDDGFVDGVFVVHAGPGAEETASGNDVYSHKWELESVYLSGDVGVKGPTKVFPYTTEPEKWVGLAPYTTPNRIMSIGTFCHEFGHVLGVPDLYDVRQIPNNSEGMGEWDLMGSGNFAHALGGILGTSPSHFSAWSKQRLGWITPTLISSDQPGVTIQPVETGGTVYQLWGNDEVPTEYFLLENRQPIGFDAGLVRRSIEIEGLPAHGLMIYHVDETVPDNNTATRKMVDVVESGGAESVSGPPGVQNLDVHRNQTASQSVCGVTFTVTGNRGDRYDPWPGALPARTFSSASCPSSRANCNEFSQAAIYNIVEAGGVITADLVVTGASVVRQALQLDDTPQLGTPNDGDGRAETGEALRVRFPLLNIKGSPTPPLYARVSSLDAYTTVTAGDSIDYGTIAGTQSDSGTVVDITVNLAPDPIGAALHYEVHSAAGTIKADTLQLLIGNRTGICDDFEGTSQRWYGKAEVCTGTNEWHRESGVNHTSGGAWAWKVGPVGSVGSYTRPQDSRLISQPIRLTGTADTLTLWQRYNTETGTDGLSVEISTDAGATWNPLHPVPNYPFGDRWSGSQLIFGLAKVPLTGYSGVVQLAFHFRAVNASGGGGGWWIDDVAVNGDATCATTDVEVIPLEAQYDGARSRVVVRWDLGGGGFPIIGIDRAEGVAARQRIASPTGYFGPGRWEDQDVKPGHTYAYWLTAEQEGRPRLEYGPVEVSIPVGSPRALALGPVRPNPFNPEATLPVSLDRDGPFALRIFRVDGTLVRTLHEGPGTAGVYAFRWDGKDASGRNVPGGLYLVHLKSGDRTRVEKAILLR